MPASRWNTDMNDFMNWLNEVNEGLDDIMAQPIVPRVLGDPEAEAGEAPELQPPESQVPQVLPILPLRGLVVYPQTAVPLTIGQPRSIKLVDDVMEGEERWIGLSVAQSIVELRRGKIRMQRGDLGGALFRVELPVGREEPV